MKMKVKARDILAGDAFQGEGSWVAMADAVNLHDSYTEVQVQHPDGGVGTRAWTQPDFEIEVLRAGQDAQS